MNFLFAGLSKSVFQWIGQLVPIAASPSALTMYCVHPGAARTMRNGAEQSGLLILPHEGDAETAWMELKHHVGLGIADLRHLGAKSV